MKGEENDPSVADADRAVFRAAQTGEGLYEIKPGGLEALCKMAGETFDHFEAQVRGLLTPERAAFVRSLRVDGGYTWRAVAHACYTEWAGDWAPPSNQLMGMALCEQAAAMLGEDGRAAPWN